MVIVIPQKYARITFYFTNKTPTTIEMHRKELEDNIMRIISHKGVFKYNDIKIDLISVKKLLLIFFGKTMFSKFEHY